MPNIKSAKKRVLVNAKKAEQNKAIRSAVRTEIKKVDALIKDNKLEEAKASLSTAFSLIDSACAKNIIHANNAANKKAKLSKKLYAASAAAPAVVEEVAAPVAAPEVAAPAVEEPVKKTTTKKPRAKKAEVEEAAAVEEPAKKTTTRKPRAKKVETEKAE